MSCTVRWRTCGRAPHTERRWTCCHGRRRTVQATALQLLDATHVEHSEPYSWFLHSVPPPPSPSTPAQASPPGTHPGEAEVTDLAAAAGAQQHVGGLEISGEAGGGQRPGQRGVSMRHSCDDGCPSGTAPAMALQPSAPQRPPVAARALKITWAQPHRESSPASACAPCPLHHRQEPLALRPTPPHPKRSRCTSAPPVQDVVVMQVAQAR